MKNIKLKAKSYNHFIEQNENIKSWIKLISMLKLEYGKTMIHITSKNKEKTASLRRDGKYVIIEALMNTNHKALLIKTERNVKLDYTMEEFLKRLNKARKAKKENIQKVERRGLRIVKKVTDG